MIKDKSSITETIWLSRYQPLAIAMCTILLTGVLIGFYVVFSHSLLHQHGKIPLVAWHWCLPGLAFMMLLNLRLIISKEGLLYAWRLGPIQLHTTKELSSGEVEWHDIRNKNKTFQLVFKPNSGDLPLPIVTLNKKGATMLALSFATLNDNSVSS